MNGTSGFREARSANSRSLTKVLLREQQSNAEGVSCTYSPFTTSSFSPQASVQSTKRFVTPVSCSMRWFLVFMAGLLVIGTSTGCSFFIPPAVEETLDLTKSHWFHYEATRRAGFLFKTDDSGKVKICSEPAPDVALQRSADFILKGAYQGANADLQAKLAEQLAQLGGRTETVLILRELLFRLCELSINSQVSPDTITDLYESVVKTVVVLAKSDHKNAEAAQIRATAELNRAESERMRTLNSLPPAIQQQFAPK